MLCHCSVQLDVNFVCVDCDIFANFSQTPTLTLNLTVSSESQRNNDSSDILSIWKQCQLFTHELNTFLLKNTSVKPLGQWGQTIPETALPLEGEARGAPSSTSMTGPTPFTTPKDSSIGSCKFPIGFNWMPHIYPQNCPFPFDDHHLHLLHASFDRPHSPSQMASRSTQPFCHSTLSRQTD